MRPLGLARTTTPQHTSIVLPVHSTNGRRGWALSISTALWVARPISGHPTFIAITPRYFRGSASRPIRGEPIAKEFALGYWVELPKKTPVNGRDLQETSDDRHPCPGAMERESSRAQAHALRSEKRCQAPAILEVTGHWVKLRATPKLPAPAMKTSLTNEFANVDAKTETGNPYW